MDLEALKFPVGKYVPNKHPDAELLQSWIEDIEQFPKLLRAQVDHITEEQRSWRYRPDGWQVKQVVHHCADSHMNALIRFKLTLTEDQPIIRPYQEHKWAELPDGLTDDLSNSLMLIEALHGKWSLLLKSLTNEQLNLEFHHPESGLKHNLAETIGKYAWHCRHHLAHVRNGLASQGAYNTPK